MHRVVLLIETSRAFGRNLLEGISQYSNLHGTWTFYHMPAFFLASDSRVSEKELRRIKKWEPNGIIMRDIKNGSQLIKLGLPTIVSRLVSTSKIILPEIIVDNNMIGQMAAQHLLEIGLTQFAFCGYDKKFFWSEERKQGFCERVREAGFNVIIYEQPISRIKRLWDKEQLILAKWLKSLPKPIGLMTCVDERSHDILAACKTADIHVPEQVALIGSGNDELICKLANPPLSSIALNGVRAGYQAAELLDKLMTRKTKMANQKIMIEPTHVETRLSTDVLQVADQDIVNAIRFIRQHAQEPISVTDVANAIFLGRRGLEKRFQKVLGYSVHAEIRQAHVKEIIKFLASSHLSISEIAMKMGFTSTSNISRFFRREKGTSLLEFRKRYGI